MTNKRRPDPAEQVVTSVVVALTPAELLVLHRMLARYVPLDRAPEVATIRDKIKAAMESL